jgi:hypothetical protein
MTSPSAESDLLIACASFSVSPDAPDFFTLRRALHDRQQLHQLTSRGKPVEAEEATL